MIFYMDLISQKLSFMEMGASELIQKDRFILPAHDLES